VKTYPFCAEKIQSAATKCNHCGSDLPTPVEGEVPSRRISPDRPEAADPCRPRRGRTCIDRHRWRIPAASQEWAPSCG